MIQRYHAEIVSKHDEGGFILYTDLLAAIFTAVKEKDAVADLAIKAGKKLAGEIVDAEEQIATLTEELRLSGLRGDSLDRQVEEMMNEKDVLTAENERLRKALKYLSRILSEDTEAYSVAQAALKGEKEATHE